MADRPVEGPPAVVGAAALADALAELRTLVYRLADEVAAFRRRALAAEGQQRESEQRVVELQGRINALESAPGDATPTPASAPDPAVIAELEARVAELEKENGELRGRLRGAAERTSLLLERTRFLRQQQSDTESKS